MIKSDNFYTLIGDTLADNWKNTSNDEEVDVFWDDDKDRFKVSSGSKGVVYYRYEDFFFHHTWVDNKKLFEPTEMVSSVICILNGLDVFNVYESKTGESKYKDKHNLRPYVADRYEDVRYGIRNNTDMPFLTENVLEFLKS